MLLILGLSVKKILLHPQSERRSKEGIRIPREINKRSIFGRSLWDLQLDETHPVFPHSLKFLSWQRKTFHMQSGLWLRKVTAGRRSGWRYLKGMEYFSYLKCCVWMKPGSELLPHEVDIFVSLPQTPAEQNSDRTSCLSPFVDGHLFSLTFLLFCTLGSEICLLLQTSSFFLRTVWAQDHIYKL